MLSVCKATFEKIYSSFILPRSHRASLRHGKADARLLHIVNGVVILQKGQSEQPLVPARDHGDLANGPALKRVRLGIEALSWHTVLLTLDHKDQLGQILHSHGAPPEVIYRATHLVIPADVAGGQLLQLSNEIIEDRFWQHQVGGSTVDDGSDRS